MMFIQATVFMRNDALRAQEKMLYIRSCIVYLMGDAFQLRKECNLPSQDRHNLVPKSCLTRKMTVHLQLSSLACQV